MAITKTNFINYTRCNRYVALENIRKDRLLSSLSLEEYLKEEQDEKIKEMIPQMYEENEDGEEHDLTEKEDKQLNAMMDFYKEVELEAGRLATKYLNSDCRYSSSTYDQESFDFTLNGIKYLCYVDIYNESEEINIIEVKATTSKKYVEDLLYGKKSQEKYPLFIKKGNFYHLSDCISSDLEKEYKSKRNKLLNRYDDVGKYIYDLSVQRYIIEHDLKEHGIDKKVNYFLAVLNHEYIYDGYRENGKRIYNEIDGEDIIRFFKLNDITEDYQEYIDRERIKLEDNIINLKSEPCALGKFCSLKKTTQCRYKDICYNMLPKYNTSFNYLNFRGFKDLNGNKYDKYDLINDGYYKMDDIPYEWLTNPNHIIQRDCYDHDKAYVNKEKVKAFFNLIEYPIYHFDFETFPCPMPRFKGEIPYTQSCFEFSLHIENEPGICDKENDNFVFLAKSNSDEREELVKAIVEHIDCNKGTMMAQNVGFEKGRLKELANVFPKYHDQLIKIRNRGFDLLYLIRNNKDMATDLGFIDDANTVNYYNKNQSGSYSIKKTLPLFTDLKYSDLEVQNGTDALVEYSKFDTMDKETLEKTRHNLVIYCQQDTWAMVEILRGLRKLVK